MSKLFTRATVSGVTLTGANLKAALQSLWDALNTGGFSDSSRATVSTTSTLATTQCGLLLIDATAGSIVLTLPASGAAADDAFYNMRRIDSTANTVTVQRAGTDTVEGGANITLPVNSATEMQLPGGSVNWRVFGISGPTVAATRAAIGAAASGPNIDITSVNSSAVTLHPNALLNASYAVNNDVTASAADNGYILDGWRLMLGAATAATATRDTAVTRPGGSGYALKLSVGAANNNKFGAWAVLEDKETASFRGKVASVRFSLAATAALTAGTGKVKAAILLWTGALDSLSASPVSAWNGAGVNPTLAAGWAYSSAPVALAVGTTFSDFLLENQTVSAGTNNLAVMIWSDDKTNATATDILRIGDGVTLTPTTTAQIAVVEPLATNRLRCGEFYYKTYDENTAPGTVTNSGVATTQVNGGIGYMEAKMPVEMRRTPNGSAYSPVSGGGGACYGSVDGSVAASFTYLSKRSASVTGVYTGTLQVGRCHIVLSCRQ